MKVQHIFLLTCVISAIIFGVAEARNGHKKPQKKQERKLSRQGWYGPVSSPKECKAENRTAEVTLKSEKKPSDLCTDVSKLLILPRPQTWTFLTRSQMFLPCPIAIAATDSWLFSLADCLSYLLFRLKLRSAFAYLVRLTKGRIAGTTAKIRPICETIMNMTFLLRKISFTNVANASSSGTPDSITRFRQEGRLRKKMMMFLKKTFLILMKHLSLTRSYQFSFR